MRYLLLPLLWLAGIAAAHAMDTTTQGLVISGYVTSQVTSAPFDRKLVLEARDDAAAFVASRGQLRGAWLEAASASLRRDCTCGGASALELAQAILVQ